MNKGEDKLTVEIRQHEIPGTIQHGFVDKPQTCVNLVFLCKDGTIRYVLPCDDFSTVLHIKCYIDNGCPDFRTCHK